MLNVEQLKSTVTAMPVEKVCEAILELRMDGLVVQDRTPFDRVHLNTCFAEIEALFQRAGYHRQIDFVGYEGQMYALFDPTRKAPVEVLRWLKSQCEVQSAKALAQIAGTG